VIVFRAEAGPQIGAGHVMRCLAVAEALQALGAEVALAVDQAARATVPRLAAGGLLIGPEPTACTVAVLDGYGFSAEDEAAWAAAGARVAVLEDAPGRAHACDLLIDPAPGRPDEDYRPWVPASARLLLGPRYAPLAPAFAVARPAALARRTRETPLRRVLVSTGLTDAGRAAPKAVAGLRSLAMLKEIVVAIGSASPSTPELHAAAAADARIRLHLDSHDMAGLMTEADLAVGAAGSSSWERCALGLPSVVVVAAANQETNAAALTAAGAALVLGDAAGVTAEDVAGSVAALAGGEVRAGMAAAGAGLVDGRGAERIAAALRELAG
jgi:UDP-2,4-diacetamido-2,4,6-trideoxy-beta-L-altropyranose hydrolase